MSMTTRKKTHWLRTTLIVLIVCGIAGAALAAVLFRKEADAPRASMTLQLTFDGAAQGIAPNGYEYTLRDLAEDEVLAGAAEETGLELTAEEIRKNLSVVGVYPEDMVSQALSYESLLDFTANRELSEENFHPTTYSVSLRNGFTPMLTQSQLKSLLENILKAYQTRFIAVYSFGNGVQDSVFELDDYDYAQQLTILSQQYSRSVAYAQELYEKEPSFRVNGTGFNDIAVRLSSLSDSEVSRLTANLTMNGLTRNTARLITQYQFEIRDLTNQLEKQQSHLEQLDSLIAGYDKNEIIYLSTADSLTKIDGNSSETYDSLIAIRKEIADSMTTIRTQIQEYQLMLSDLLKETEEAEETSGEQQSAAEETTEGIELAEVQEMTEEEIAAAAAAAEEAARQQIAVLEADIAALQAKGNAVLADFVNLIDAYNTQHLNEETVSLSTVRYREDSLISAAYIKRAIKVAGPFCAVGFMVCMVLIIISRKKEEKRK